LAHLFLLVGRLHKSLVLATALFHLLAVLGVPRLQLFQSAMQLGKLRSGFRTIRLVIVSKGLDFVLQLRVLSVK
jgi:hypothetical protein